MLFDIDPNCCTHEQALAKLHEIAGILAKVPVYACDIETTGLAIREDRITIISLACEINGEIIGWSLDLNVFPIEDIIRILGPIFRDSAKRVVFHNATFDIQVLNRFGIWFKNAIMDTMVMVWLIDEDNVRHGGYGLKHCALKYFNYQMSSYEDATSLFGNMAEYAADDAKQTLRLYILFLKMLQDLGLATWFETVEMPITQIIIEAETRGVMIDGKQLKLLKADAYKALDEVADKIYDMVGYKFDIASPKQLARILFDELKLGEIPGKPDLNEFTVRSEKSKMWSTADAILTAMRNSRPNPSSKVCANKIATLLLEYREINTKLNVFINPLLERFRDSPIIHPRFLQVATVSGRFASRDPNYQNLPRKGGIRKAFIARPGYVICRCDYSQAELRLMAHMSGDPVMKDIYLNGGDIHQKTADACSVSRQAAKAINFGLIYRMSGKRLALQLAGEGIIISLEEAQNYVRKYFDTYIKVREYHRRVENVVTARLTENGEQGYVRTLGGRYRRLDKAFLESHEHAYSAITQAINTTIQGGVSDLIKVAMIDIQNIFKQKGWLDPERNIWDAFIQGQVHDELFVECREDLANEVANIVSVCMVNAGKKYKISVPMIAEAHIVPHLDKG